MLRLLTVSLVVNCAAFAVAGHGGGGFGGFGFGGHRGGGEFGGLGYGLGLGIYSTERTQERFEYRFDNLTEDYEEGLAEITDFYTSDEYADIVDDTELLTDRYDLFINGVERSIDRLTDFISIANDDLTYYNDLLAEYQADEELSAERLERIEDWIARITGHVSLRIDRLTEVQTSLEENLPTYLSFQTEVSTFLSDIIAAGEPTDAMTASLAMFSTEAVTATIFVEPTELGSGLPTDSAVSTGVPEPSGLMSLLVAIGMLSMARRRPAR